MCWESAFFRVLWGKNNSEPKVRVVEPGVGNAFGMPVSGLHIYARVKRPFPVSPGDENIHVSVFFRVKRTK